MRETNHDLTSELNLIDDQDLNNFYSKLSASREVLKKELLIKKQERFSDFLEVVNSQAYQEKTVNFHKNLYGRQFEQERPLVANQMKRDSFEEKVPVGSEENNDSEEEEKEEEEGEYDDHNRINYE